MVSRTCGLGNTVTIVCNMHVIYESLKDWAFKVILYEAAFMYCDIINYFVKRKRNKRRNTVQYVAFHII